MAEKLTVLNPQGYPPRVERRGLAPSLDSLSGKKVFLVDVGFENSDNFMRQLQGWLADHEPTIQTDVVRWADQHQPDPALCERIASQGDAAILGVGL
jgi:hypothetical protein